MICVKLHNKLNTEKTNIWTFEIFDVFLQKPKP